MSGLQPGIQPPALSSLHLTTSLHNLPAELRIRILEELPTADIKNARLSCSALAVAGAPELFRDGFIIRPDRDDKTRLRNVSMQPDLASGIKHLKIAVGDVDLQLLENAINIEMGSLEDKDQREFVQKTVAIIKYMQKHIHGYLDTDDLSLAFSALPNLKALTVSSVEYPFSSPWPSHEPLWQRVMTRNANFDQMSHQNPVIARAKWSNILMAVQYASLRIESLDLDLMPLSCLGGNSDQRKDQMRKAVSYVKHLRICLLAHGRDELEEPSCAKDAADFLGSMRQLRSLDLTWGVRKIHLIPAAFENAWDNGFYANTWPYLKSLRMQNMESPEAHLFGFLKRHASTLKYLHLSGPFVLKSPRSSYKNFLTSIRDVLKLQKFELIVAKKDLFLPWNQTYEMEQIYNRNWESLPMSEKLSATLLEAYVLGTRKDWPMVDDNPDKLRNFQNWRHL